MLSPLVLAATIALLMWVSVPGPTGVETAAAGPEDEQPAARTPSAERGYRHMLETAYVPGHFDQALFDKLWTIWPEPLRARAERASVAARRSLAFTRYGLTPRPGEEASGKPLQFVVDAKGVWSMNCLACHAGHLDGRAIPGLPNSHLALQTLYDDVAKAKRAHKVPLGPYDLAAKLLPMGTTNGTTNAVIFSVALLKLRNKDLEVVGNPMGILAEKHHDLDAPPWWNVHKRPHFYVDGFAKKNARTLMQFMLVPQNGPEVLKRAEADYDDMLAYLENLRPPAYPGPIDAALAAKGKDVYMAHCSRCHGDDVVYPDVIVPLDEIGTDPVRFRALSQAQRTIYTDSWLAEYDAKGTRPNTDGYVAPPLDGIWASAPYFHNGSVPTLWHLLRPSKRPKVWRRSLEGYDYVRGGLALAFEGDAIPENVTRPDARRAWFDTSKEGKSATGHLFPAPLLEAEKDALLEYLKTL